MSAGQPSKIARLTEALTVIATLLESPPAQARGLEYYSEEAGKARENLRLLAIAYDVAPARDILAQAANVARAAVAKAAEPVTRRSRS